MSFNTPNKTNHYTCINHGHDENSNHCTLNMSSYPEHTCHQGNCHQENCQQENCQQENCQQENCQQENCQQENCHMRNCHMENCQQENCHQQRCWQEKDISVPHPPSPDFITKSKKEEEAADITNKTVFVYNDDQCGLFQIVHITLTQLPRFTAIWALFLMSFGIYSPGWRACADDQQAFNLTTNQTSHHHHLINTTTTTSTSLLLAYAQSCPIPQRCENVEFLPGTRTIVTRFGLICDKAYIPSLIISVQMAGMLVGSIVAGQVSESFGRKAGVYSSTAVLIFCSGLSVLSTSWVMYSAFIFGIGFGGGGIISTYMVISTEFLSPKWRGRFASIPVNNIALAIFACIVMTTKDWVFLHLITSGVSFLALLGAFWVPESLLWLREHGKLKQMAKVLRKIALVNKLPINDSALSTAFITNAGTAIAVKEKDKKTTVLALFRTYPRRVLTLKCSLIYGCIQMAYYTIGFGVQALPGNFYTNFLFSVLAECPFLFLVGPASNGLGRRWASSLFAAFASVFCLAIAVVYHAYGVSSLALQVLAILARAMVACIVQTFNLFMVELFPTSLRSIGFGFVSCISRVGLIAAPFLIPTTKESLPISFSCLAGALLLSILGLVTLPETKNLDLSHRCDQEVCVKSSLQGTSCEETSSSIDDET